MLRTPSAVGPMGMKGQKILSFLLTRIVEVMSDTARSVTGDYVEPEGGIQMPAKELSLPLRSTDRPNNTRQICIHFRIRPDKCKYGDKCNFSHDLSTALPTTGFHANNGDVNSTVRNTGGGRGFAGGRGGRGGRYYNAPSNNML